MKRYLARAALLLALALLVAAGFWVWHWLQIDSCLDRGGRWNYEQSHCEGNAD
jgi:hypothetical protein